MCKKAHLFYMVQLTIVVFLIFNTSEMLIEGKPSMLGGTRVSFPGDKGRVPPSAPNPSTLVPVPPGPKHSQIHH